MKKGKIVLASFVIAAMAISGAYALKSHKLPRTLFRQTANDCITVNCHENPTDGAIACPVTPVYRVKNGTLCSNPAPVAFVAVQ